MTILSEISRVDLVGDGANDTFTFTFEIYAKTDLLVYVDGVEQTVDVHYTIADECIDNPDGGEIVFGALYIPAADAAVSIILNLPLTQKIDYIEAGKFPAETHERGLDRLTKIAQQLKERLDRAALLIGSSQYSDLTMPDPVASKLLAWKDDLSGLKNMEVESEGDLTVTDFIKTLLDDEDVDAFLTTLGIDTDLPTLSLPADTTISAFAKTLLDDADAGTAQSTLGISAFIKTLLDDADADAARTTLELEDHSARHENGGADEINVTGLSGELADDQEPKNLSVTEGKLADSAITQAKLKTSTGSVNTHNTSGVNSTLPGGEYGFYPRVYTAAAGGSIIEATIAKSLVSANTPITNIWLQASSGYHNVYASQRYITSSGEVHWVFISRNKTTKEIQSMWQAPDHPCFGNGGKPLLVPHPFGNYDSEAQEIIVITPSKEQVKVIQKATSRGEEEPDRDFLDAIFDIYEIDETSEFTWPTEAVTVGLPKDWDEAWIKQEPVKPIKKVIPKVDYILCKGLKLKTK